MKADISEHFVVLYGDKPITDVTTYGDVKWPIRLDSVK